MTEIVDHAVTALRARFSGSFDGIAKFLIENEGAVMLDGSGVRAGDEPADVTLIASAETFRAIISGELSPTMAFMGGKLRIEGDMALAMKLGPALG